MLDSGLAIEAQAYLIAKGTQRSWQLLVDREVDPCPYRAPTT